MTSRERILAAIDHEETDRVPIDLGATNATGISAVVYRKLKELLEIRGGRICVFDMMQQLAEVEPEVRDALGADAVMVRKLSLTMGIPFWGYKPGKLTDGTDCFQGETYNPVETGDGGLALYKLTDGSDRLHPYPRDGSVFDEGKIVAKMPKGSHAFARVYHPLADGADTIEELNKFRFPEFDKEELDFAESEAKRLFTETDKAVVGIFQGNVFELGQLYWGYQKFFENLMLEPDLTQHYFKQRTDAQMRDLEKYLQVVGQYIQIINFCDDLGTQSSLLLSPTTYRELIKPCHARMFGYVKKNYPHIKIFFHSCGAVYDLIPDFIEIGVDILNPVQITAEGMDPARLKKEFGKRLTFWGGGVDTQKTLCMGDQGSVTKMARDMLDIFSPGGGYIFSQVHNIEANVPAENVLAAFMTAKTYNEK